MIRLQRLIEAQDLRRKRVLIPISTSTPPLVGASSMKTYIIEGLKKGDVNIRFYLVRPWEQNATPVEEKFYLVHVVD